MSKNDSNEPRQTRTCRNCGGDMVKEEDKWVCTSCKQEMPA